MRKKQVRVANKKRFTIFLSIVFVVTVLIINNVAKINLAYSSDLRSFSEITIVSGDTLWDIAKRNNPYNQDVRKVVHEIMKINNMKTAEIKAGRVIKIPTY
ncbi:LysM peptidoglycan-binding domain-containing protein [Proteiniborus sp.]|uniref:LysM peptidoglycan-binding domain-containing protein n=1 Tax=Proteiniborus sp. TaxID=2079015 RepID=UPI00332F912B